jgi:DNA-binding CsgD family transcriptional regulator
LALEKSMNPFASFKKNHIFATKKWQLIMDIIDRYFIPENRVKDISEEDYGQVASLIAAFDIHSRLTYKSMYIVDFHRKNFLYVADNPLFLCGFSPTEIKEMGIKFNFDRVPEQEHDMLLEINRARFNFINHMPIGDRLKLTFSCDFHIRNENETILINHKFTPAVLSGSGNVWLAGCLVSLSHRQDAGHVEVRIKNTTDKWDYSLESHKWERKDGIDLTNREKQILRLSMQGLTMDKIADRLYIGINSIKSYKRILFKKMKVSNISEAIQVATDDKLII